MAWFRDTRTIDQLVRDVGATTPKEAAPHYKGFAAVCALVSALPLVNLGLGAAFYPEAKLPLLLPFTAGFGIIAYRAQQRYRRLINTNNSKVEFNRDELHQNAKIWTATGISTAFFGALSSIIAYASANPLVGPPNPDGPNYSFMAAIFYILSAYSFSQSRRLSL